MKLTKLVLIGVLIISGTLLITAAQRRQKSTDTSTSQQKSQDYIEVQSDRFSNEVTILLHPITIYDTKKLKLNIDSTTLLEPVQKLSVFSNDIKTELLIKAFHMNDVTFGNKRIHFLVDGKRINVGEAAGGESLLDYIGSSDSSGSYDQHSMFSAILTREDLESLSKAIRIEMLLGPIEITLNNESGNALRSYAKEVLAQKHKMKER